MKNKNLTGQEYLSSLLRDMKTTHLFYQEYALNRLINNLEKDYGVKPVLAHSELAVGYMADGYARSSGRPGVCFCQSIGAANLAASLHDAWLGNSPVVSMTGCKQGDLQQRNAYQESNHTSHFSGVTKYNVPLLDEQQVPHLLRQSFREATTGCPRPTHIELPGVGGEVWEAAEMNEEYFFDETFGKYPAYRPSGNKKDLEKAVALINKAEKPVIVSGRGVFYSDDENVLTKLAEKASIPVVTTPDGKTTIDETHSLWAGIVGSYGMVCANKTVAEADLVIYLGSQVSDQTTFDYTMPAKKTQVVQVDIDGSQIGKNYPNTAGVVGDSKMIMLQLLDAVEKVDRSAWLKEVRNNVANTLEKQKELENQRMPSACNPARLCKELTDALPDDAVLFSDTGWSAVWTSGSVRVKTTQKYIRAAGSLGWSFPASLGGKCANPDRPVFCFLGDGGFFYHTMELETAVRNNINTITILNNNWMYAQCVDCVDEFFDPETEKHKIEREKELASFTPVNFAKIAEELGAVGIRVEKDEDIAPAIQKAMTLDKPVLIEVITQWSARPLDPR